MLVVEGKEVESDVPDENSVSVDEKEAETHPEHKGTIENIDYRPIKKTDTVKKKKTIVDKDKQHTATRVIPRQDTVIRKER